MSRGQGADRVLRRRHIGWALCGNHKPGFLESGFLKGKKGREGRDQLILLFPPTSPPASCCHLCPSTPHPLLPSSLYSFPPARRAVFQNHPSPPTCPQMPPQAGPLTALATPINRMVETATKCQTSTSIPSLPLCCSCSPSPSLSWDAPFLSGDELAGCMKRQYGTELYLWQGETLSSSGPNQNFSTCLPLETKLRGDLRRMILRPLGQISCRFPPVAKNRRLCPFKHPLHRLLLQWSLPHPFFFVSSPNFAHALGSLPHLLPPIPLKPARHHVNQPLLSPSSLLCPLPQQLIIMLPPMVHSRPFK